MLGSVSLLQHKAKTDGPTLSGKIDVTRDDLSVGSSDSCPKEEFLGEAIFEQLVVLPLPISSKVRLDTCRCFILVNSEFLRDAVGFLRDKA